MNTLSIIRRQAQGDILDHQALIGCLTAYSKPRDKISRLLSRGDIVRVRKGLYVLGEACRRSPVSKELLANLIHGPSYISMDYALSLHGLIPERVEIVTSVALSRSRQFETPMGTFSYRSLTPSRYAVGAILIQSGEVSYLLASPEKALVDKVWTDKRFQGTTLSEFAPYLEEDLRIDPERLFTLDAERLRVIDKAFASRKIHLLVRHLQTTKEKYHA